MKFNEFRKKVYDVIEPSTDNNVPSKIYDIFMLITITASLFPLAFKEEPHIFFIIDKICVFIFIIDYILRWATADFKFGKHNAESFLKYPFSLMAIIDLLSILPSLTFVMSTFKMLRVIRMIRALRVIRIFKAFRYFRSLQLVITVIRRSKNSLIAVCGLALAYILVSALVVFNVEPDTFPTFFDAVYWATVSLTTVGYGDIYPVTGIGRFISMTSSMFGVAIIALPAGVIAGEYLKEVERDNQDE